jgi:single-strand DNA-binding protein
MHLNKSLIYGNITKDPELKSLQSGASVCSFSVATNRTWIGKDGKKQEESQFHNIVCFGKTAENVAQYMRKGSPILIEGRIQTRSWEAKDGSKRYTTEIVAEQVQFGPKKVDRNDDSGRDDAGFEQNQAQGDEILTEDLPF